MSKFMVILDLKNVVNRSINEHGGGIKVSKELADKIINAFSEFTPKEAMLKTKNSKSVQEVLASKYGDVGYSELTRIKSEEWGKAWRLFEQHYGVFTHGDYEELMK